MAEDVLIGTTSAMENLTVRTDQMKLMIHVVSTLPDFHFHGALTRKNVVKIQRMLLK